MEGFGLKVTSEDGGKFETSGSKKVLRSGEN